MQPETQNSCNLMKEAIRVFNDTGLSPAQLAKQRAELVAALERVVDRDGDLKTLDFGPALAALAKARGE
jgi:hypothetical protein